METTPSGTTAAREESMTIFMANTPGGLLLALSG